MRKIFTENEIEKIVLNTEKLTSYQSEPYPLNSLQDREFEVLLFFLFKAFIEDEVTFYDKVTLMSGVGEQGRDVILSLKGKDVGIVQCKKYKSNLDKPSVAKEVIKFALYQLVDGNLMPKNKPFQYFLAVSTGLTNTAKKIIRNHPTEIIENDELEKWTQEVINVHKSLNHLVFQDIKSDLCNIISKLSLSEILPQEIKKYIDGYPDVANHFFKVQKVTDNTLLEKIIKKYLEPILKSISINETENIPIDFKVQFKKYLEETYEHYSYAKTLVFGNQQKKLENFYVPLTLKCTNDEEKDIQIKIEKYPKNLIPKFKKVLISDTGGMGKSTVMKWLFLNAIKQNEGIPIFIELRVLKNEHLILDEILKQLQPISENYSKIFIQSIIEKGKFIFFFDGFDEIGIDHRENVIIDLQNFIRKAGNNFFILTSRPESALFSFADFQEFKINPLKREEAYSLIRKLGNNNEKSERLIAKIEEQSSEDFYDILQVDIKNPIHEFLENPLLISLLFKKFEHRESIPFDKRGFYIGVFDALFEGHDITKDGVFIRFKKSNLNQSQFHQLLRALGFITLKIFEIEYSKSDLIKYIQEALKQCPEVKTDSINFLDDIVSSVPLFLKDADIYRWQHKSIQEYFAAEFICTDSKESQVTILKSMVRSNNFDKLRNVLLLCYEIDYKTFRNTIIYDLCNYFINYCNSTFKGIISESVISEIEIRKRQAFNFLQDESKYVILNIDYCKNINEDEIITFFNQNDLDKCSHLALRHISLGNYILPYIIALKHNNRNDKIDKNNSKMILLLSIVNSKIILPKNDSRNFGIGSYKAFTNESKNIPILVESINMLVELSSNDNYRRVTLTSAFSTDEIWKMVLLDDKTDSILNHEKHFNIVNNMLEITTRLLNYNECLKLVQEVEQERKELNEKSLASGF
jgi:hypothetical protein